jgi:hypothetical protein
MADSICKECFMPAQACECGNDCVDELDEYEAFDCHMDRNGHCDSAGSEDCEFECPYRRDQYQREREKAARAAERKRSKGGRQPDLSENGEAE